MKLKIPAGAQVGQRFRLRERGLPKTGGGRTDLYVQVGVTLPEQPQRRRSVPRGSGSRRWLSEDNGGLESGQAATAGRELAGRDGSPSRPITGLENGRVHQALARNI